MKKLFLFAMAAVALASCSESDELALSQAQQEAGRGEVAFSVYANRTTRAGKEGVMDMTNLQNADAGFGIFGYHTNNSLYDPQNSEPNFMYNQRVTWNTDENKWTYDPVKYWPNEFGENAVSNDIDYVSFFAYAPYVEFDPISGVALVPEMPVPETDEPLTPEEESQMEQLKEQLKNQIQWKNITGASRNGDKGDPFIRYMVDTNPSTSVDLMWGVAADNSFQGLANPAVTSKEGECFINLSKQIGVNQTINWRFHHALAKLDVQIIAACDVATEGTTEYAPAADAIRVDDSTRVYLRWIEFSGFAMSGALSLNSKAPQAHWLNYDGATELKSTTIRFNDGLLNGKEGILDNVNPNEVVLGALNPELIEEPTPLVNPDDAQKPAWLAKNKGIPTDKYANVFKGATENKTSFYVIPTNAPLTINMLYDIETMDTQLNKYLSDGVTPGARISNEITKELRDVKIEAGKAYTIKIVVGLESVKVNVEEVKGWENATGEDGEKVDMPYNPARRLTVDMQGIYLRSTWNVVKDAMKTHEAEHPGTRFTLKTTTDIRPLNFTTSTDKYRTYTGTNGKNYQLIQSYTDRSKTSSYYLWVEDNVTIDNGTYFPAYRNSPIDNPSTPGNIIDPNTIYSSYYNMDSLRFISAMPFKDGMKGLFIKEQAGSNRAVTEFEVIQSTTDPKLVTVKVYAGSGITAFQKDFNTTTLRVNTGFKVQGPNASTDLGWFVVE